MSANLTRRTVCVASLLPVAVPLIACLPGCGGGFDTDAPAQWAGIAVRAAALAPAPGLPPFISARAYAMAFLAAHNALQAILPVYATYLPVRKAPGANADAAVSAAVHDVLVHEFPFAAALLDAEYASAIAAISGEGSKPKGISIGQRCAAAMLADRANDGLADAEGPYAEGTLPGQYRFTFPFNFAASVHFGDKVKPFSIGAGSDFRAPKPYGADNVTDAVKTAAYAADFNEVKTLGVSTGSTRTAEQSDIGKFWLENTNDSCLQVSLQLAESRNMPGWELMRALALIQVAQVDAYIACLESKYHYGLWRPVSAIHLAGDDGNDATAPDAAWTSFDPVCPPVPDYPSGHSASGGAGDAILAAVFGGDAASFSHQSVTLPGPTRRYSSFSQMGNEIAASRVYVGYHFRLATTEGLAQGRKVAAQVLATRLARRF